ncbi:hypothetical protein BD626DRAFT_573171 [Schizophyllum amplum]|uniref:F-box domain-containing protein n=1 Tax=Schizophyllum amplum TaxID=97359 RepID=A0A550C2C5_9AGAR|nr:hypothetical protein BD626DRAFT_573171 [Auriculariopsis ampla]
MHYALSIPEIRHTICAEVVSHDALSKLSRVSHDWHDSANVILWQSLDSLIPLLRLMPAEIWKMKEGHLSRRRKFTFCRPLKPHDWTPVYERATLVREILLHQRHESTYDKLEESEVVLRAICHCPPPLTLLPRLRRLEFRNWGNPHEYRSRCFLQLVSSSLKYLHVEGPWPKSFDFTSLVHACPAIETIRYTSWELDLSTELAGALVSWRTLTDVDIQVPGRALGLIMSCLAQLPSLAGLRIYCAEYLQAVPSPRLPHNSFPSLRRLVLVSLQHVVVDAVICSWDKRQIQALTLSPHVGGSAAELLHTIACLNEHCEPLALDELTIAGDWLISLHLITPLSRFCNLTNVAIGGTSGSGITDDGYAQLAQLWPKLRRLQLGLPYFPSGPLSCTLSALLHFAKNCHHLERLTLPLDAIDVPNPVPQADLLICRNSSLTYLHVGRASINDPTAVALFLSAIFPGLQEVVCSGESEFNQEEDGAVRGREMIRKWAEVRKMLGVLRKEEYMQWDFVEAMVPGSRVCCIMDV